MILSEFMFLPPLTVPTANLVVPTVDLAILGSSRLAYYGLFSEFLILSWILREVAVGFNLFKAYFFILFCFFEVKDRKKM